MSGKILIVDDSVAMRQVLALILNQSGYQAETAADGFHALQLLNNDHALAIIDYNMPGLNGIELTLQIRNGTTNPNVPILMVSTDNEADKIQEAREAGATGWITKPFDQVALLEVIKRFTSQATPSESCTNHDD